MKLLFNVLTAVAAVFPAIAAENGDTGFVDFGELDQSPPVFYNRQRTMPAIMSPQVNTSMAVGEIPFSESVTPSGGKIYNVPVAVSEESRLRPEVSLLYNSQGAEGAAGYGWSISGVSAISVVNMTLHYDGVASSPDLSDPDGCAFALDGVRLLEREDAADGFAFETAEGFVRARKVKSGGALTRFDVRYPDGRNWAGKVDAVHHYRGATYVIDEYRGKQNGITIGRFINMNDRDAKPINENGDFDPTQDGMYMHEYGHYLQSQLFGPLYLFSHGITSFVDAMKSEHIKGTNYKTHDFYWTEIDANKRAKKYFVENEELERWPEYDNPTSKEQYPY